ncbi:hypothetical protein AVEN_173658-1 [Araneus ventricosus]|uniref:Uncharacterized protein n=1 Tax=Araneus ventricosus TaxID=182803 RepID=A0A4Y2WTJ4_ARAVE|nr:hypothetical protein AVEN_173658-1 [Araneus ventricosus]
MLKTSSLCGPAPASEPHMDSTPPKWSLFHGLHIDSGMEKDSSQIILCINSGTIRPQSVAPKNGVPGSVCLIHMGNWAVAGIINQGKLQTYYTDFILILNQKIDFNYNFKMKGVNLSERVLSKNK